MRYLPLLVFAALLALVPRLLPMQAPHDFELRKSPRPLHNLFIVDSTGKAGALSDFRGRFVLLNIWATWCVPCRKEMPTLDRLQGQLGGPHFEVVALSIDHGGADVVQKFYADVGIQNLAVRVDAAGEAPFELAAIGIPTTLLVNPQGEEIGRLIGPAEWDSPEMVGFLKPLIAPKGEGTSTAPKTEDPT